MMLRTRCNVKVLASAEGAVKIASQRRIPSMSQALLEPPLIEPPGAEPPLMLHLRPVVELTDDQFFALCAINRDLRLERTAEGDIIITQLTGFTTGSRDAEITRQFGN